MKRLIAVFILGFPMWAADSMQVPWDEICLKAGNYELVVKTADGETIQGYCATVDAAALSIRVQGKVRNIARDHISKLVMIREAHPLKQLGRDMRDSIHEGKQMLLTSAAPLGVVLLPATIAWGAVAAPFCLIGELRDKFKRNRDIVLK